MFNNLMSKVSKVLERKVTESNNRDTKFDYVNVLYFREYNYYVVYKAIYCSEFNKEISLHFTKQKFNFLSDIEDNFKQNCSDVRLINVLSRDYVYLTKSGVNTDGSDFRLDKEILADSVFHCIYVNSCLDYIDIYTSKLDLDFYNPYDKHRDKLNKSRWSLNTVSKYLSNDRMCVFLRSKNCIMFDENLNSMCTKPKELLYDLTALSKTNQLYITDCGDLGMQISFK